MSRQFSICAVVLTGLAALSLSSCSHMSEITSSWNGGGGNAIAGGSAARWTGALWDISDAGISVGAKNDSAYLYLCMITTDRSRVAQILSGGMTWWLNGDGGKDKTFGLRFPVGGLGRKALADLRNDDPDALERSPSLDEAQREFEVVNGSSHLTVSVAEGQGVLAKLARDGARFICELRVPLVKTAQHPYAAGVDPTHGLSVGLDAQKAEARPEGGRPRGGGEGGEGGGGMRGGRGGGGRGGMGGMRGGGGSSGLSRAEGAPAGSLEVWLKVALAQAPGR